MLVRIDKIIVNLAQLLTVCFKDDKTLFIAYMNNYYWEHKFATEEEAEEAYESLCKKIKYYESTKE